MPLPLPLPPPLARRLTSTLFAVGLAAVACTRAREAAPDDHVAVLAARASPESAARRDSLRAARATTAHVIVVSLDGLRPDAIERYHPSTLERLRREGRYALHARTILPSTTIPSHASMLSGLGVWGHHVLWNDDDAPHSPMSAPTVFAFVKREGLSTAAVFSKSKFRQLIPASALDVEDGPDHDEGLWSADHTVDVASKAIAGAAPALLFVHLAEADYAGHTEGWMSDSYGDAVRIADAALGRLLAHADSGFGKGAYTVIVTADHGGHDRTHGSPRAVDVTIPWIVWGRGVAPGAPLDADIQTMDTAATALWLLGIEVPRSLVGRVVRGAF